MALVKDWASLKRHMAIYSVYKSLNQQKMRFLQRGYFLTTIVFLMIDELGSYKHPSLFDHMQFSLFSDIVYSRRLPALVCLQLTHLGCDILHFPWISNSASVHTEFKIKTDLGWKVHRCSLNQRMHIQTATPFISINLCIWAMQTYCIFLLLLWSLILRMLLLKTVSLTLGQ